MAVKITISPYKLLQTPEESERGQNHQTVWNASGVAASDVRRILAEMRAAKNAPHWRALHERLSVAWQRYRCCREWMFEIYPGKKGGSDHA